MKKIQLQNSFTGTIISHHGTVRAAVIAARRHAGRVARRHGPGSYIPYAYRYADGERVEGDQVMAAEMEIDRA